MAYFIHSFNNLFNAYKYHYLDHITSIIDIRENYWSFIINLFSINDFFLPVNSLAGDLYLPYQQINNISFNLATDQSGAKVDVEHNANFAKLYTANFNVDISQNELFKQDLNNIKLDLNLVLYIDPEAAKGAGTDVKQDELDHLMKETSEQRWDFSLYYSNTYLIDHSATIENVSGYSLPLGHDCIKTKKLINFNSLELNNLIESFNTLANISSSEPFQILSAKVKFYYWIEFDVQCQTLEKVINVDHSMTNQIQIDFNDNTLYDFKNNKVILDPLGIKGFYIPKFSQGYYELEMQIMQNNSLSKFIVKNAFSFAKENLPPTLSVTHRVIKEIDYKIWKVIKNYD